MVIDLLSPGIRKSGTFVTISQLSEQKSDWILGKGDVQSLSEDASSASSDKQKKQETATKAGAAGGPSLFVFWTL